MWIGMSLKKWRVLSRLMSIKHAVITSVDRDDLKDMGSIIWAETVKAIRRMNPNTTLETLIPDFQGNTRNLDRIIEVASRSSFAQYGNRKAFDA